MPPPMTFLCQRKTRPCEALVPCADIPAVHPTEQASSPFSALAQTLSLTLVPTNRLSVALLMQSLVLCNQVLSELRRVHFTRSQGTCSNQDSKPPLPPSFPQFPITPVLLFTCVLESSTAGEEPGAKSSSETNQKIKEGSLGPKLVLFLFCYFRTSFGTIQ